MKETATMTVISLPVRERRGRTLVAALLAPASLLVLDLLWKASGSFLMLGHLEKYFFEGGFLFTMMISYAGAAVVGGMASVFRWGLRAPLRAGVVVSLFAASAAMLALLIDGDWRSQLIMVPLVVIASLPVSLVYCAIVGIRWR